LLRDTRLAYLELAYQDAACTDRCDTRAIRRHPRRHRSRYRTGRNNLQDVLSAQLERALLDDRRAAAQAERAAAQADLQRWTGPLGRRSACRRRCRSSRSHPTRQDTQARLETHPRMLAAQARVAAGQSAVAVARQQYKPGWMLDLTYGDRSGAGMDGARRSDLLSAMVTLDLPLFTGKRQDRRVAASVAETDALRHMRDDDLS
jgi:outer membrane protein TolC